MTFAEAAGALVLLGVFQSVANVGLSMYLQESLPTATMGRILGTTQAGQNGLIVMAILAGGGLAHAGGVRLMMTVASLIAVAGGYGLPPSALGPGAAARFVSPQAERRASS